MNAIACPICDSPAPETFTGPHTFSCPRCGRYTIEHLAMRALQTTDYDLVQRANASGWIRASTDADENVFIKDSDLQWLMHLATPNVEEKAVKLLRHLATKHPIAGQTFQIPFMEPALRAITWTAMADELHYIAKQVLGHHHGYLLPNELGHYGNATNISPKGHAFLERLRSGRNEDSHYGFVAMRFNEATVRLREEGLKPAIANAGYSTTLIDEVEHLEHIDDQILAAVRRCRFLVADLTGQRQNVYYEAGFAQGLGVPVIWTCRTSEITDHQLHLDVRQYAFIDWEEATLDIFRERLTNRIVKALGPGPFGALDVAHHEPRAPINPHDVLG